LHPASTATTLRLMRDCVRSGSSKEALAEGEVYQRIEIGMDCQNDRYVNDEKIATAVSACWPESASRSKPAGSRRRTSTSRRDSPTQHDLIDSGMATSYSYEAHSTRQEVINTPA